MIGRRLVFALVCAAACLAPASSFAENFVINVIDPMAFEPNEITIKVGDTVTFQKGTTSNVHNVQSEVLDDQCTFGAGCFRCGSGGCQGQGGSGDPTLDPFTVTLSFFDQPGTVPFRCGPHGPFGMTGRIIVQPGSSPPPPPPTNSAGKIRFSAASYSRGEDIGAVAVQVERTNGSSGAVGVTYDSVAGGSATSGGDFTPVTGTLSWANGEGGAKTFELQLLEDDIYETNETIKLALRAATGGATLGNPSNSTVTILDDDAPNDVGVVTFTSASFSVAETASLATVTVSMKGSSNRPTSVDYQLWNGTAAAGQDYTMVGGSLDWPTGEPGDRSFQVPILDDATDESSETISVTLSHPVGVTIGSPATATVTIFDNESVPPCTDGEFQVCLLGRFLASIHWARPNNQGEGAGRVIKLTDSAASFEFFEAGNVEVVVKMKDACALPLGNPLRNFWPFVAGLTNVRVELTIIDTRSGAVRRFFNALGQPFFTPSADSPDGRTNPPGAIQAPTEALGAFATCDV